MAQIDPRRHLNEAQRAELKKYSEGLMRDLNLAGFDEESKKEYYDFMMKYRTVSLAADTTDRHYDDLVAKLNRIKAKYEKEKDFNKAQEYLAQYNKNKRLFDVVENRKKYLDSFCYENGERAKQIDDTIDRQLELQKQKEIDNKTKKR